MIPVSVLTSRIRTRYEAESGGSSVRWTDTEIRESASEGLETLAEATGFYERYCTIPIKDSRTYYDLRGFTNETVVSITSIWSSVRNQWLDPISITDLDYSWQSSTGDPLAFFTRGIYWFGVYPMPTSDTGTLRVHFKGVPPRFTHPQAILGDLPDNHYPALEDYVLYDMAAADGNSKRALAHWGSYIKREKALSKFVDHRIEMSRSGRIGGMAGKL